MKKLALVHVCAEALFNLAVKTNTIESILKNFELLVPLLQKDNVMAFFSSPQTPLDQKKKVLEKVFYPSNLNAEKQLFFSFLVLILKKDLFKYLSEIAEEYKNKAYEKLGRLEAFLVTAAPLEPSIENHLIQRLEKSYGKKILLKSEVDPHLLGGGILKIRNKMIDFSLKNRLDSLKKELLLL